MGDSNSGWAKGWTRLAGRGALETTAMITALIMAVITTIATLATTFTASEARTDPKPLPGWFIPAAITVTLIGMTAVVTTLVLRDRRRAATKKEEQARFENAAEHLQEKMELASLVNFNRILLERYHGIATKQANKSFYSSIGAMIVGLAVLVVAFVASMQFNALGERVFIGSLAVLSTVFVGYLSKTFMVVYDRSLQQLNQYFNQPVLNQYFLSAERIADRLDEQTKNELLSQIVLDVLATGKQMHSLAISGPTPAPVASRRRRVPAQQQTPVP
ncbi:hypothetical protein ACFVFI_37175 [Streptomyces sp. NPDC057705]|uniref:TRADD-N-associated membrane domain-containing protein n=1 Tax=Streptomyces sp. NPDC057705 TaxID=3346222 RepID=UPI0036911323